MFNLYVINITGYGRKIHIAGMQRESSYMEEIIRYRKESEAMCKGRKGTVSAMLSLLHCLYVTGVLFAERIQLADEPQENAFVVTGFQVAG